MIAMRTMTTRLVCASLAALSWVAAARGEGLPKVAEGFQIRLVAGVPAVQYPSQVCTAPGGALFVGEDPMDQVGPADKPIDRILLFREGQEPVVFADKLNAIFGMAWRDGALYVMNMPHLTMLRDTNGDGRADERKEIFTNLGVAAGFPNNFNDHIVSGLQFGIDGYLYIAVGDKGVPKATGPDGRTATLKGGGVLRCRPDGTGLEIYSSGTRNHLEPNLDDRDNLFTYDNTDDGLGWWTRVTHHIDGGYFGYPFDYHERTDAMLPRIAEYGGGSPCGGVVYREDAWPETFRGRVIWAEWGKRKVSAFRFEPSGGTFKVKDVVDLVEPGDVSSFRPVDVALSYDGRTLYIADWSLGGWANKDEKLGRVYAVTYTGKTSARPRGSDSDPVASQIAALAHPSYNERVRAQRALTRLGSKALVAVKAALNDAATGAVAQRHLVWVVDAIEAGSADEVATLSRVLKSNVPDVRAQAARALGERGARGSTDALISLLSDGEPSVRLQAAIALGRVGEGRAVPALTVLLTDADLYVSFGARVALRRIGAWNEVERGLETSDARQRAGILETLDRVYDTTAAGILARYALDSSRPAAERAEALSFLAEVNRKAAPWDGNWWGTQPARGKPPEKTIAWAGTPAVVKALIAAIGDPLPVLRIAAAKAVRTTGEKDALDVLRSRFPRERDAAVQVETARTLGALDDEKSLAALISALRDPQTPDGVRDAVLVAIESIGGVRAQNALIETLRSTGLPDARRVRVMVALGQAKSKPAVKILVDALKSRSPEVRAAAASALGEIGVSEGVVAPLRPLLGDASVASRRAAIAALGSLRDKESLPALLKAVDAPDTRYEAMIALCALNDPKVLQVYLAGLADKSPALRKASAAAIASIRDQAVPVLEALAARRELPSSVLPELSRIYTGVSPIMRWKLIGPFKMKEAAPFAPEASIDFATPRPGAKGKPVSWRDAPAIDARGHVDLERLYGGDADFAAYGYAELTSDAEREARFVVGSDDTLTVWVNGREAYKFDDHRAFRPDEGRFQVKLAKGTNRILIRCGNFSGPWGFAVAVSRPSSYAFLKGPAGEKFDPEKYRAYAMKTKGLPERGRGLFHDLKGLACVKCHNVAGQGGAVGPELSSVGAKYPRAELIAAVLYPSSKIASGYEPAVLALSDGRVVTGIVKAETAAEVEVETSELKRVKVAKQDIEERKRGDVSIMPNGLAEGLTPRDFADLIAYLETLRQETKKPAAGR